MLKIMDFLLKTKTVVTQRNHCCKVIVEKKQSGGVLGRKPNPSMYKIGTKKDYVVPYVIEYN